MRFIWAGGIFDKVVPLAKRIVAADMEELLTFRAAAELVITVDGHTFCTE